MWTESKKLVGESIETRYVLVREAVEYVLPEKINPKLHDHGKLADSFYRYGFRGGVKFSQVLNGGYGGLERGNGRTLTLHQLEQQGRNPPRGVRIDSEGRWWMPLDFGVELSSESEAINYVIDDNASIAWGGSFTAIDTSRLFEQEALLELLDTIPEPPLSFDDDDQELLRKVLAGEFDSPLDLGAAKNLADEEEEAEEDERQGGSGVESDRFPLAIVLSWVDWQRHKDLKNAAGIKKDSLFYQKVLTVLEWAERNHPKEFKEIMNKHQGGDV